jgi:hypothetical protein
MVTYLKFIAFLECSSEDMDDFIEVWKRRTKAGHIVKTLFPPHTMATGPKGYSGFTIFETDNTEDIMHYVTEYSQVASVKVFPIWESKKGAELYQKLRLPMKKSAK